MHLPIKAFETSKMIIIVLQYAIEKRKKVSKNAEEAKFAKQNLSLPKLLAMAILTNTHIQICS